MSIQANNLQTAIGRILISSSITNQNAAKLTAQETVLRNMATTNFNRGPQNDLFMKNS